MKTRMVIFRHLIAIGTLAALSSVAQSTDHEIFVNCFGQPNGCSEMPQPDPITIAVGDSVNWFFSADCNLAPCTGTCTITVPAVVPGFAGFGPVEVDVPGGSASTPPFTKPGTYTYTLACTPDAVGTITVVGSLSISVDPATRSVTLTWTSEENATYSLQWSANLAPESWIEIDDQIEGEADITTFLVPAGPAAKPNPAAEPRMFFRVLRGP